MFRLRHLAALWAWSCVTAAQAQVTTYDAQAALVTIPSVSVGDATFTGVTLKHRGDFVFELAGYADQPRVAFPGVATYDAASRVLTLPAVKVGEATYIDVRLQDNGSFVFRMTSATPLPQEVIDDVNTLARASEQQVATGLWRNGTERMAQTDACWASAGRTRANLIADYDANLTEYLKRDAYLIGRKIRNIQVLAVRNRTNPDGSTRREVDVQWDVAYTDGSVLRGDVNTLISGSSAGTPRCTTAQTGPALRALGDQRLVNVRMRSNNMREERYAISGGAPLSPQVRYRREVDVNVTDPMGNATHVVVSGPGPSNTTGGVTYPFSMVLVSPRLLRSAPEFAGKSQNYLNWLDDDGFVNCALSSGAVPVARLVDCVALVASGSSWGIGYTATADATADAQFAAQGWVAGAVYRFDVYNDDGWKTVNGTAGKTPIATYYATLDRLPYTFVQMADRYPVINLGNLSPAQIAANTVSATPVPMALSWTRPATQPDGRILTLNQVWEFHSGPKTGNASGAAFPAYRVLTRAYPGTTATSMSNFPVTPPTAGQNGKTSAQYNLFFWEPGSSNSIRTRILFQ